MLGRARQLNRQRLRPGTARSASTLAAAASFASMKRDSVRTMTSLRLLLLLLAAAPAHAEYRRIELKILGMDCATCAHGVRVAMQKLERRRDGGAVPGARPGRGRPQTG